MQISRVIADLPVSDLDASRRFYGELFGLTLEEFNLGWVARFTSPDTGAHLQVVTQEASAPELPIISVMTPDVDAAYAEAQALGVEIVHPLTTEEWGVRRFFVRDPDGNVINVLQHRD
jgi:predicted enzyme related to lactoylglutathione lyase